MLLSLILVLIWLFDRDAGVEWRRIQDLVPLIQPIAAAEGLDPALVQAVILVESGGRPAVRSSKEAIGLMQVRDIARREVQRLRPRTPDGDLRDPVYNLRIGCAYLAEQLDRFDHDLVLALAAYNAGPSRVSRWRKRHPKRGSRALVDALAPKETRNYYRKVLAAYERLLQQRHEQQASPTNA